jgi:hypothetical protein
MTILRELIARYYAGDTPVSFIAEQAQTSEKCVRTTACRMGIKRPHGGKRQKDMILRAAIRAGYARGTLVRVIASETGSTVGTVKVLASQMRLVHPHSPYRRVKFVIPPDLKDDYKRLQNKGFDQFEIAAMLGLAPVVFEAPKEPTP